jgi:hypothetical protein
MENQELIKARTAFLDDTLDYYGTDTSRRATVYYTLGITCQYRTDDGRKCAIGRHIPDEYYYEELEGNSINNRIFKVLPENIQKLGVKFLENVQKFHDNTAAWNKDGITGHGKIMYLNILNNIEKY